jgi:ABC-type phosphate transport system substrate-binding protein
MYTDGQPEGAVKEFIDFVKSSQGQKIAEREGYVGLK